MKQQIIIVAGGSGARMQSDIPKQFLCIEGVPIITRTILAFRDISHKVLVLPAAHIDYWQSLARQYSIDVSVKITEGGATRMESVKNGLSLCNNEGLIGIHDAVRPFPSQELIHRLYKEAGDRGAAIPVIPLTDTLRNGNRTVDRSEYCLVQTPQVFRAAWLFEAYAASKCNTPTDDASVVEAAGYRVSLVDGEPSNMKITTPTDLIIAETLCNKRK